MNVIKLTRRAAPAMLLAAAALATAGCSNGVEREGERVNRGVKEDVRGFRDFLHDRGISVNTRLPER